MSQKLSQSAIVAPLILNVLTGQDSKRLSAILKSAGNSIDDFDAYQKIKGQKHVSPKSFYKLFYPYNSDPCTIVLTKFIVGVGKRKDMKASV